MASVRRSICLLMALFVMGSEGAFALDAVDIAAAQVNAVPSKTYVRGENGPNQFDCSGLTWYAFASVGIELPWQAKSQAEHNVGIYLEMPAVSDLQRGDLLFFATNDEDPNLITHVGIYEGNGKFHNSVSEAYDLRRSDLANSYWSPRFRGARRMPTITGTPSSKFAIGDAVTVTADGVSVRHLRQGVVLGTKNAGEKGAVSFGPVREEVNGTHYWWWYLDFGNGFSGWVVEDFLEKSAGPIAVADADFSSWTPFSFVNDDPGFVPPGPGTSSASIARVASGGHSDAYLSVALTIYGGDTSWGGAIKSDFSYDPSVLGAIQSLTVSADVQMVEAGATAWQLVVEQDGKRYYSFPFGAFSTGPWTTVSASNLTASNFDTNPWAANGMPPDGARPDFGASGKPMKFGFMMGNALRAQGAVATANHGLDNFLLTINR